MEYSGFIQSILGEAKLPRFTPTDPPPRPELIRQIEAASDTQFGPVSATSAACLRSLLFVAAGDLDRAHVLVQELTSSNASYIHGMIHRIEGDFGNARYWFHQARIHPTAPEMYRRASANSLTIASHPVWDPDRVTDLAERARQTRPSEELRVILTVEFEVLVEHLSDPLNNEVQ